MFRAECRASTTALVIRLETEQPCLGIENILHLNVIRPRFSA
jgi:hypothetical protein